LPVEVAENATLRYAAGGCLLEQMDDGPSDLGRCSREGWRRRCRISVLVVVLLLITKYL
jgi:hypothetical protein